MAWSLSELLLVVLKSLHRFDQFNRSLSNVSVTERQFLLVSDKLPPKEILKVQLLDQELGHNYWIWRAGSF